MAFNRKTKAWDDKPAPRGPHDHKSYKRKWNSENPRSWRRGHLKARYGLSIEDYDALHDLQDGRCRICHKKETERGVRLAVDHCHMTGVVRGLLCGRCNRMLGLMEERIEWLDRAIRYLRGEPL